MASVNRKKAKIENISMQTCIYFPKSYHFNQTIHFNITENC